MRKDILSIRLLGATVALAFGTSMAQSAMIAPGVGQEAVDAAIPVVDTKAGISAGGIGGAGVSVGGGGVGIGADVQGAGAKVGAGVSAGSQGGQVGATAGATASGSASGVGVDADAGASAGVGDGKVDAGAGAAADTNAGGTEAGAGAAAGANAGAGGVNGSTNVEANTGTGQVNVGAGVSASPGAGGVQVDAGAGVSSDTETANHLSSNADAPGQVNPDTAGATSSAPAVVQATTILLPLPPSATRQAGGADSKGVRETQLAAINCVDGLADDCYSISEAQLKPIPPSRIQVELADATDGAASVGSPISARPTQGVASTDAGAIGSFEASLADPVRTKNVLVVRCIIANTGTKSRVLPPLDVRLMNDAGEIVGHTVLSAPGAALAGRQEKTFTLRIYPLPPNATRLVVGFVSAT